MGVAADIVDGVKLSNTHFTGEQHLVPKTAAGGCFMPHGILTQHASNIIFSCTVTKQETHKIMCWLLLCDFWLSRKNTNPQCDREIYVMSWNTCILLSLYITVLGTLFDSGFQPFATGKSCKCHLLCTSQRVIGQQVVIKWAWHMAIIFFPCWNCIIKKTWTYIQLNTWDAHPNHPIHTQQ